MIEQKTITKRLIKDTIHECLIDYGFNKKQTKNIRMCLEKICEVDLVPNLVFESIEEIFCHNLGLENKNILDSDELFEYLFDNNVDDKKFVELIYQKILSEYSVVKLSIYITDRFLDKFVFLKNRNAFIYFSIGIFLLVVFIMIFVTPSNINNDDLATDSQMIWCLAQENDIEIGSIADATGWSVITDRNSLASWSESEVEDAKNIYNILIATVEYYEYIEPDKTHPDIFVTEIANSKFDHIEWLTSVYTQGTLKGNNVSLFFDNMKSSKDVFESDKNFFLDEKEYNEALKENRKVEYINLHSICKLWYEASN